MDNKETEKLIEGTLNSEKPNKKVLCMAMEVMKKNKSRRIKPYWSYGLASCAIVAIALGIFLFISESLVFSNTTKLTSMSKIITATILLFIGVVLGTIAVILIVKYIKRK